MGKRRDNCDHDRLEILPGNNILCQRCGEAIEAKDLFEADEPIHITQTTKYTDPKPLTYRLIDLALVHGDQHGEV